MIQPILSAAFRNASSAIKAKPTAQQIRASLIDHYQTSVSRKFFDKAAIEAWPKLNIDDLKTPVPIREVNIGGETLASENVSWFLESFQKQYLAAKPENLPEEDESLAELQYSVFGIQPLPTIKPADLDKVINVDFIKGMMFIANLKVAKFNRLNPSNQIEMPLKLGIEDFPVLWFHQDFQSAIKEIRELKTEEMDPLPLDMVIPWVKMSLATKLFESNLDQMQAIKSANGESGSVEDDFLKMLKSQQKGLDKK